MKIIIASDIFGRTPELENIAVELSATSFETIILDPYLGNDMKFADENKAYEYFKKNVGLEQYKNNISKIIMNTSEDLLLVGFSVGASAIWALSEQLCGQNKIKAICFYGSQIRDFLDINPKIEMDLIFPEYEPHFDVANLILKLSEKKNVRCYTATYQHGFMNKKSNNFNQIGYDNYLKLLKTK